MAETKTHGAGLRQLQAYPSALQFVSQLAPVDLNKVAAIAVQIKARDLRAGMVEAETGRRLGSAAYWSLSDGTAVAVLASWLGTDTERVAPDALYTIRTESLPDGWAPSEQAAPEPPKRRMQADGSGLHSIHSTEHDWSEFCAAHGCTPVDGEA